MLRRTQGRDMNARDIASRRIVTLLRSVLYFGPVYEDWCTGYSKVMLGSIFNSQVERESSPLPARHVQIRLASADQGTSHISISNTSNQIHFLSKSNNRISIKQLDVHQAKQLFPISRTQTRDQRRGFEENMQAMPCSSACDSAAHSIVL
jgi:hypothetical protein